MSFCRELSGCCNFNPRSPRGERRSGGVSVSTCPRQFQSTLPARGATRLRQKYWTSPLFQSTLPARGATDNSLHMPNRSSISIHAPREGSDCARLQGFPDRWDFNPRSPRGERHRHHDLFPLPGRFQSTLPARGATTIFGSLGSVKSDFNPRSPRGERPPEEVELVIPSHFNPRSPRGERHALGDGFPDVEQFQSTLPARGATVVVFQCVVVGRISIHAPREGSDRVAGVGLGLQADFNPRSPRGERPSWPIFTT